MPNLVLRDSSFWISALALIVSVASFLWNVVIHRRRVRQDLYEKRFQLVQTITRSANYRALSVANPKLDPIDRSSPLAEWMSQYKHFGRLADDEMQELRVALQQVGFLYDKKTAKLAMKFYEAIYETQALAHEHMLSHANNARLPDSFFERSRKNWEVVKSTSNQLLARMARDLRLN